MLWNPCRRQSRPTKSVVPHGSPFDSMVPDSALPRLSRDVILRRSLTDLSATMSTPMALPNRLFLPN
jgi:hypothetical protein